MFKKARAAMALLVIFSTPAMLDAQQLQVVDATGKVIGDVLGTGAGGVAGVVLKIDTGGLVLVYVARDRFATETVGSFGPGLFNGPLFFESTDCSGTPFLVPDPQRVFVNSAVKSNALYAAVEGAAPETIIYNSYNYGVCQAAGPHEYPGLVEGYLAIDLAAEFAAPYSVEIKGQKGHGKPVK